MLLTDSISKDGYFDEVVHALKQNVYTHDHEYLNVSCGIRDLCI